MPVQCTCPECHLSFTAPAAAGPTVACPICDTPVRLPGAAVQVAPRPAARPTSAPPLPVNLAPDAEATAPTAPRPGRRRLVVGVLLSLGAVYLVGGIAAAVYFLGGDRQAAGPAPAPQARPEPTRPAVVVETRPAPVLPVPDTRPTPPPPPLTEDQKKVNAAIDKGVAYLKEQLAAAADPPRAVESRGSNYVRNSVGAVALMGLTLLECGERPDDPLLKKTADVVRKAAPRLTHTYSLSLAILFLDRAGDEGDRELVRRLALRLVAGQVGVGSWGYDCRVLRDEEEKALLALLTASETERSAVLRDLSPALRACSVALDAQGKPAEERRTAPGMADNSNAQFAILALWVARRHGLPVQPALAAAERHFRDTQAAEGSWSYRHFPAARGGVRRASMTCAGLLALAVGRSASVKAPEGGPEKDAAVEKGFRFLAPYVGGEMPRGLSQGGQLIHAESWGDLYYLWSLERVAMIYDLKKVGGKDWYAWASRLLVDSQKADGSWQDAFPGPADTCFALLILRRVNVVQDLTRDVKKVINIKDLEGAGAEDR